MTTVNIDGKEIEFRPGQTILSIASEYGIPIPTLCNDENLKPQGACGLCVVEVTGSRKLLRACGTPASNGMEIKTRSPRVDAARKAILEFMLSAHTGDCRPPCLLECPANSDCQGYVGLIAKGRYREAAELMKEAFPLPASVGRICPHPCEKACRRKLAGEPVNIAGLKYFAADKDINSEAPYIPPALPDTGKTVAVAGGGPAGLTAAYFLRLAGHRVTVYDKMPKMGGLLRYGIPEYRLPKAVLDAELNVLEKMGIQFENGTALGRDIIMKELHRKFDGVIVATGAGLSKKMRCPGENLPGVLGGINFLEDAACEKEMNIGSHVMVVGGSNTAMDAARTALRLGAPEVTVVYRRSREEMPAQPEEIREAEEEGVIFKFLTNPIEILGGGRATHIRLQKMALGEPDASGRRSPVALEGQEEIAAVSTVIMAIGQDVDKSALEGYKEMPGVFECGDVTGKTAFAIEAIGQAKKAAAAAHAYITGEEWSRAWTGVKKVIVKDEKTAEDFKDEPRLPRQANENAEAAPLKNNFREVKRGLTEPQAKREADRCLSCGCAAYFDCKLLQYANEYNADPLAYSGPSFSKPKPRPVLTGKNFTRDSKKCILCGMCVRVCEEQAELSVFSMADRGFDTGVATAFEAPLSETDCNDCDKCVAVCPTGALSSNERPPVNRNKI